MPLSWPGSVAISSETATHYLARGRYAANTINGVSRARVQNSSVSTNSAGGVSVSSQDNSRLEAESPAVEYLIEADLPIDISATIARNELRRDVEASVTGSSLEATGDGDIVITATKNVVATATASATTVSKSLDLTPFGALSFGGTFASNVIQGDVDAYVDESTLTTAAGNVTLDASDNSEIRALAQTSAASGAGDLSIGGSVLAIGASIAFNSLGWETQNVALDLVDAIIGDPLLADNVGADVRAYLRNTTVDAGGALSVSALADALIESVVTNQTADTSSSPIFGASSSALGGVVSSNKISGVTEASIYFDGYVAAPTLIADDGFTVVAEDSRVIDAIVVLTATSETSNPKPLNGVDALGISGAVALNDVRGGASASIDGATLSASADGVSVSASADASVRAFLESAASSAGGNNFGQGSSLAAGGLIATNIIQGGAEAYITNSTVGTATDSIGGDVSVDAINSSTIDAHLVNATESGSQAVTLSLAFNTVGWTPQNILFNTVDAILGDSSLANAFGNEQGAGARAYLLDTTVVASGSLAISALNDASISSDIANTSTSSATAWIGANGLSFGGVIASNKVSAEAEASIDWTDAYLLGAGARSISTDGGIAVTATNQADLSASIELDVSSETVNTALGGNNTSASDAIGISGAVSYNDVRGGATAFINRAESARHRRQSDRRSPQQLHLRRPGQQQRPLLRRQHLRRRRLHRHLAGGIDQHRPGRQRSLHQQQHDRHQRPDRRRRHHLRAQRHCPDGRNQQPHHLRRPIGQRHPGLQHPWLGTAKHPVQPR